MAGLGQQHDAEISERAMLLPDRRQCRAMMLLRLDRPPGLAQQGTEGFVRVGVVRCHNQGTAQRGLGVRQTATGDGGQRGAAQQPGLIRRALQRLGEGVRCLRAAAQVQQHVAQIAQRHRGVRLQRQGPAVTTLGLGVLAADAQQHAQIGQNGRLLRRLPQQCDGERRITLGMRRQGAGVQRVPIHAPRLPELAISCFDRASQAGGVAQRGGFEPIAQPIPQRDQRVDVPCRGNGTGDIGFDVGGDPVIQPDSVQDRRAEQPHRRPSRQGDHRHALIQRLDRRGAGVVRERIQRDVDRAICLPGTRLWRRADQVQPIGRDAMGGEAGGHDLAPARIGERRAVQHQAGSRHGVHDPGPDRDNRVGQPHRAAEIAKRDMAGGAGGQGTDFRHPLRWAIH